MHELSFKGGEVLHIVEKRAAGWLLGAIFLAALDQQ